MSRPRQAAQCKLCGKEDSPRHRAGVYHRQRRKIHAMLRSADLTLVEIARRLGVSRQRVQHIARQSGYSGRARQMARALKRHGPVVIPQQVEAVARLAERHGLVLRPIPRRSAPGFIRRRVIIAGRRCVIQKVVQPHLSGPGRYWLHFRSIKKDRWPEFVILPFKGDAFIVLARMYRGTIFVFGRKKQAPRRPNTIKWETFYGAWDQLRSSQTETINHRF